LRVLQIRVEELRVGIGHFKVTGKTVFIAQPRKTRVIAQRCYLPRLRGKLLAGFSLIDQRIVDLLKRGDD
jgi:hypothetical protein